MRSFVRARYYKVDSMVFLWIVFCMVLLLCRLKESNKTEKQLTVNVKRTY